ncbi:hypothetical protein MLD38_015017 [Melastoma candidum]|uniref:Uncharacterized protein n=1 Tax=Melastoma candidum TaxID=119954 RepID=A0ACB9RGK4_9MYRT|nr:hypothetical protein MLD38_015017 [Melastoma candidum]
MDIRSCCGSACRSSSSDTIHLGEQRQPHYSASTLSSVRSRKPAKWTGIWARLVKEKHGHHHHHTDQFQVPSYDSHTYSQNFDHGVAWEEPDNISRSFSVRFANPALLSRTHANKNGGRTAIEVG